MQRNGTPRLCCVPGLCSRTVNIPTQFSVIFRSYQVVALGSAMHAVDNVKSTLVTKYDRFSEGKCKGSCGAT
jgi:hypothetical protein